MTTLDDLKTVVEVMNKPCIVEVLTTGEGLHVQMEEETINTDHNQEVTITAKTKSFFIPNAVVVQIKDVLGIT